MKTFLSRWLPVLAWAAVIFLVSAQPEPLESVPQGFSAFLSSGEVFGVGLVAIISFLIHFVLYFVLGLLAGRAMLKDHHEMSGQGRPLRTQTLLLVFALCFVYALSDEWHQTFVRGRGFEAADLLADALGILAGLGLYTLFVWFKPQHPA